MSLSQKYFKIPSGETGKMFIEELTFWLRQFNSSTIFNSVALKVFMTLPSLMLQKPLRLRSKAKDHADCLRRRLELWRKGDIEFIFKEIKHIQSKLVFSKRPRSQEDRSCIFTKLVMEGKLNAALKFLDEDSGKGVRKLSESFIKELKENIPTL